MNDDGCTHAQHAAERYVPVVCLDAAQDLLRSSIPSRESEVMGILQRYGYHRPLSGYRPASLRIHTRSISARAQAVFSAPTVAREYGRCLLSIFGPGSRAAISHA